MSILQWTPLNKLFGRTVDEGRLSLQRIHFTFQVSSWKEKDFEQNEYKVGLVTCCIALAYGSSVVLNLKNCRVLFLSTEYNEVGRKIA